MFGEQIVIIIVEASFVLDVGAEGGSEVAWRNGVIRWARVQSPGTVIRRTRLQPDEAALYQREGPQPR